MGSFCDTGLNCGTCVGCQPCPRTETDQRCSLNSNWFQNQIDICKANYTECANNIGDPTPFEIYNSSTAWLSVEPGQNYSAALNRGVVGNKSNWSNKDTFYPSGVHANEFPAWIHNPDGFGCKIYGFSYDDTTVKDGGDVTMFNCPSLMTVTVTLCPWG